MRSLTILGLGILCIAILPCLGQQPAGEDRVQRDDWSILYFDDHRSITKIEVRLYGPTKLDDQSTLIWKSEFNDKALLELIEYALSSEATRRAAELPGEGDAGDLPFGHLTIHTTKDHFRIEMRRGFSIDGFSESDRFHSWILAKLIDDLYSDVTRKHLDVEQFGSLVGQPRTDAGRRKYFDYAFRKK